MGRAALGRGSPPGCDQGDPGVPTPPPHQHPGPLWAGDHTRSAAHPPTHPTDPAAWGSCPQPAPPARRGWDSPPLTSKEQGGSQGTALWNMLDAPPTRYSQQGQAPSTPSR